MSSRVRSPARSQGSRTPRRISTRSSRSVGSPGRSTPGRLSTLVDQFKVQNMDSFAISPMQQHSVLSDNTQIEEPRRKSWWKKLDDKSREVLIEAMSDNHPGDDINVMEDLEVEILSQEKKTLTLDLPDSSGSESISSIVIPQRKLFYQKENVPTKKNFSKIIGPRESMAKHNKTNIEIPDNNGPKKLFGQAPKQKTFFPNALNSSANKTVTNDPKSAPKNLLGQASGKKSIFPSKVMDISPKSSAETNVPRKDLFPQTVRTKSVFPSASLAMSPNKTTNKTLGGEVKGQVRSLFGNKGAAKRKNMFADFIVSESEDEIPEIQPKAFSFPKKAEKRRRGSSTSLILADEDEDWKMLPSSTMMELEKTPLMKPKLSRIPQAENDKSRPADLTKTNQYYDLTGVANAKEVSRNLKNNASINKFQDNENMDQEEEEIVQEEEIIEQEQVEEENASFLANDEDDVENQEEEDQEEQNESEDEEQEEIEKDQTAIEASIEKADEGDAKEMSLQKDKSGVDLQNEDLANVTNLEESILKDQDESQEINDSNKQENYEQSDGNIAELSEQNYEEEAEDQTVLQDEDDESMELTYEDENQSVDQNEDNNDKSSRHVDDSLEQDEEDKDDLQQEENEDEQINQSEAEISQLEENDEEAETEVVMSQEEVISQEEVEENEAEEQEDDEQEISNQEEEKAAESEEEVSQLEDVSQQEEEIEQVEDEEEIEQEAEAGEEDTEESELDYQENQSIEQNDEVSEQDVEVSEVNDEEDNQENQQSENEIQESPYSTHDTTGRNRKDESPEAIRQNNMKKRDSFEDRLIRNTSIRKTKSMIQPNIEPLRLSVGSNSSAEGSGWDSHRTTKKTIRQTFGKGFTPRKSLRALVMEKSAKRQTLANEVMNAESMKIPQANSTEIGQMSMPLDDNEAYEVSTHEVSRRTRQTTLEMYLEKIKMDTLARKKNMESVVRQSLQAPARDFIREYNINPKQIALKPKPQLKPKKIRASAVPLGDIPMELLQDINTKPPKRFTGSNASWITKRLYKFLESKLEPRYDYKAGVRAEKFVESLFSFTKLLRRHDSAPRDAVRDLKAEMARLRIVDTHKDFYEFFHEFMPREIRIKVVPDVLNKLQLPRDGVFSQIQ